VHHGKKRFTFSMKKPKPKTSRKNAPHPHALTGLRRKLQQLNLALFQAEQRVLGPLHNGFRWAGQHVVESAKSLYAKGVRRTLR
jgi:hypothetical protein